MDDLLDTFFLAEADPKACHFILDLMQQHQQINGTTSQHVDLNIFELDIDYVNGTVALLEIISPCRETTIPLHEFSSLLSRRVV